MPRICSFYGIVIRIYYADHAPPHFHAAYGEDEGSLAIESLEWLRPPTLPRRAQRLTLEWAELHQAELLAAWHRAQAGEAPGSIDPLP